MGEAKRRAERRREAREKGLPFEPLRTRITGRSYAPFFVSKALDEELQIEFAHFKKEHSDSMASIRAFMHALLESAVEFQRRGREARENEQRMVQPAVALPPGMAEAAKQLQAMKRGA